MSYDDEPQNGDGVSQPERYPLDDDAISAIASVTQLIRPHISRLSPRALRSAATVLLALERLPIVTPGVLVRLSFSTPDRDGNYGWADIEIGEEGFRLGLGEHFYDPAVGGDTESRTVFEAQAGSSWQDGDVSDWLESAQAIALCGPPSMEDYSDYDVLNRLLEEEE